MKRLREIGVLDPLLKLAAEQAAASDDAATTTADDAYDASIDAMDVADLVQAAFDGNSSHERGQS
ncbi:hypothetical protein O1L55_37465 [Streptomyces albulus]|nr:hypothetical protein [Streptomyces noursei]